MKKIFDVMKHKTGFVICKQETISPTYKNKIRLLLQIWKELK